MSLNPDIERRISVFVDELSGLVRKAALESVHEAFAAESAPRSRHRRGRPPAVRRTAAPSPRRRGTNGKKGAKRDPKIIGKVTDAVKAHIKQHPGEGVEAIAKHLRLRTSEITLPIGKLLASKAITKKGAKRATKYFPR
jgi:hypothetical protein